MAMSFTMTQNTEGTVFKTDNGISLRYVEFEVPMRHPDGSVR